ncbi:acetate/propionate family kinase [Roseibium sp. TrichSKD4]|uniref:acetate/propionate family kinase n=1 Tax=Roseibium sp. TrichSKD4 TaxID=744980 RepID=UPI0002E4F4FF|nr:acetate/propionate family kinase [Roseibium sp. TrichSKD4]
MRNVLVLNSGSSSVKFALFGENLTKKVSGSAVEIGGSSRLTIGSRKQDIALANHENALAAILSALDAGGVKLSDLAAAAHRVVHGGQSLSAPHLVTAELLMEIERCSPFAPLHNPHNLSGIRAVAKLAPNLPQYVSFDTAFHATNPDVATTYAIRPQLTQKGLRRYGFHGISYQSLVHLLPELSGEPLPKRLLAFHLGNGASICAIRDGQSVATTMGYSPLEGLTMGTRCGSIDGNAVLKLVKDLGASETSDLLNRKSGFLALGGMSDMRELKAADTPEARFAVDHFCYWAVRHAGSMIAALGGADAIAFTGGIGENDAGTRERIVSDLSWLGVDFDPDANSANSTRLHTEQSKVQVWIVPAEEEAMIVRNALSLMEVH